MASTNVTIPINRVTKDITATITISGMKVFRARLWLGTQIFRLGAAVMGIGGCEVNMDRKTEDA